MSIYAIQQYHKELEKIIHFGGSKKETAIRNSFYNLLNEYARSKDLMLIPEISTKNKAGKIIFTLCWSSRKIKEPPAIRRIFK